METSRVSVLYQISRYFIQKRLPTAHGLFLYNLRQSFHKAIMQDPTTCDETILFVARSNFHQKYITVERVRTQYGDQKLSHRTPVFANMHSQLIESPETKHRPFKSLKLIERACYISFLNLFHIFVSVCVRLCMYIALSIFV